MQRILVTGGAGFIGSALVRRLTACGKQVLNIDKLSYAGSLSNLEGLENHNRHTFIQADIADTQILERCLNDFQPEAILHLAAESHVDRSIANPAVFIQTNLAGTFSLLESVRKYYGTLGKQAREAFRFLQISTDEVYGELHGEGFFTEKSAYAPRSPYAATKAGADHLADAWHTTYGLPVMIAHACNNYGPRQFPEKLIPMALSNALQGKPIALYGDGKNIRDWLYVEDHAHALTTLLEKGRAGEHYVIGGRCEKQNIDVILHLCALLDELRPARHSYAEQIVFIQDRPGHDRRYALDPSKIERETGWSAQTPFEEGLRRTVEWYLAKD